MIFSWTAMRRITRQILYFYIDFIFHVVCVFQKKSVYKETVLLILFFVY